MLSPTLVRVLSTPSPVLILPSWVVHFLRLKFYPTPFSLMLSQRTNLIPVDDPAPVLCELLSKIPKASTQSSYAWASRGLYLAL